MKKRLRNASLWWIASDLAALTLAYHAALYLRANTLFGHWLADLGARLLGERVGQVSLTMLDFYLESAPRIIFLLVVPLIVLNGLQDLYDEHRFLRRRARLWLLLRANTLLFMLVMASFYLQRNLHHPRSFFFLLFLLNIVMAAVCRHLLDSGLSVLRNRWGVGRQRALLVGHGRDANLIAGLIETVHPHGITVVDHVVTPLEGQGAMTDHSLAERISAVNADMLVIADPGLSVARIMSLLELASEMDLSIKVLTEELNVLPFSAGIATDTIRGVPLVHFDPPSMSRKDSIPRRALSFGLTLAALVVSFPVMLLSALLVKLEDDGPIFFVQERVGVNRRPFKVYKFRTMHEDAEQRLAELEALNESGAGLFKMRRDPRVTRVGRIMRKYSIDELPQLFNILKGDMRIVGPRPLPRRDFEHYYENWHYSRHDGMPGLTCLWQISGRSEIDFENMCILDVYYLRNQNWAMDLKIVIKTIWVVLFARGAY